MNIRHQGQWRAGDNLRKAPGRIHIRHRQAHDLAAGLLKPPDLLKASLHIRRFCIEHGLDTDRSIAADGYPAHVNLPFHFSPSDEFYNVIECHKDHQAQQQHQTCSMNIGFILGINLLLCDGFNGPGHQQQENVPAIRAGEAAYS